MQCTHGNSSCKGSSTIRSTQQSPPRHGVRRPDSGQIALHAAASGEPCTGLEHEHPPLISEHGWLRCHVAAMSVHPCLQPRAMRVTQDSRQALYQCVRRRRPARLRERVEHVAVAGLAGLADSAGCGRAAEKSHCDIASPLAAREALALQVQQVLPARGAALQGRRMLQHALRRALAAEGAQPQRRASDVAVGAVDVDVRRDDLAQDAAAFAEGGRGARSIRRRTSGCGECVREPAPASCCSTTKNGDEQGRERGGVRARWASAQRRGQTDTPREVEE